MERKSELEIILGTMFSGKTTYIMNQISKYAEINIKILYINTNLDDRSNIDFSTHNPFLNDNKIFLEKESIKNNLDMIKLKELMNYKNEIDNYDIIIIDESHFFEDLLEFTYLCLEKSKFIIVAGLIADSKGKKFGKILDLIPVCTEIKRLHAYCKICGECKISKIAIYSKKIDNSKKKVDIGGSEKYIPVCYEHYKKV
jgi:thymidine kinase